jgi:hypothetical protein
MDQEQSSRWLEALNQEKKSRQRWQQTYMTSEELEQMREDEATLMSQSSANRANRRINHQEAMEMRCAAPELSGFIARADPPAAPQARERLPRSREGPRTGGRLGVPEAPRADCRAGAPPAAGSTAPPAHIASGAARASAALQVAAARPRSHHITKKTDTASLLQDIGPGLWVSVNPAYTHQTRQGCAAAAHR